jgi:hypothetical protein
VLISGKCLCSAVIGYQFGTRTADFHICARCGVVPVDSRLERLARSWIADVRFV